MANPLDNALISDKITALIRFNANIVNKHYSFHIMLEHI